ncbi:hypothetical protein OYT1_ch0154 [Ferriphaselus amnicola]|uniref:DUF2782 domain-containing protein n=1 Tax=Ferriphaselus amnicola TaxID=1188319 RepID=A0A2Z6G8D8_9PROT|nr:DUF2782 domain-containing protein [Ferriphaselus amnicola]BBE49730.1 hypothetical protein OYT1_ch0154 [Ferriphaselus amnicola]
MRRLTLVLLALGLSASALAADSRPAPDLKPVPPPPAFNADEQPADAEPEVTIKKDEGQVVEEYRAGGRLYMIKITPKHGKPYYLVDDRGDGKFARQESLDSGVRAPSWTIHRF